MHVMVVGTRGIPNILGGVERHCEELYPRIVKEFGVKVTIICRSCYVIENNLFEFKGISLKCIYAPRSRSLEAIVHTFLSVLYAAYKRPDILHIHAIGPSIMVPLARLFGLKVIMTHHGPDYNRKKWGRMAKMTLKVGEWAGIRWSNRVIVISNEIKIELDRIYGRRDISVIPNGTSNIGKPVFSVTHLDKFCLERNKYIFTLGRFVPEKGFDYLIRAFEKATFSLNYKLVIAGDADHENVYSISLKDQAKKAGVVLTGFLSGEELAQVFSGCCLFILPSFYEGLPISLLEAMGYRLPIIASNIPANTQVGLPEQNYFEVGNEQELIKKIEEFLNIHTSGKDVLYNMSRYNWDTISFDTNEIYESLL